MNQDLCAFIYTEINEADAIESIIKQLDDSVLGQNYYTKEAAS